MNIVGQPSWIIIGNCSVNQSGMEEARASCIELPISYKVIIDGLVYQNHTSTFIVSKNFKFIVSCTDSQ